MIINLQTSIKQTNKNLHESSKNDEWFSKQESHAPNLYNLSSNKSTSPVLVDPSHTLTVLTCTNQHPKPCQGVS